VKLIEPDIRDMMERASKELSTFLDSKKCDHDQDEGYCGAAKVRDELQTALTADEKLAVEIADITELKSSEKRRE
jgi:hypothetical protein